MSKQRLHLKKQKTFLKLLMCLSALLLYTTVFGASSARAVTNPQNGSVGLEATVSGPPPSQSPSVSVPSNKQTFNSQPITVAGICKSGLLVKIFDNNVFGGAAQCTSGSFTLQVSLFSGSNLLTAQQYDGLGQSSPASTDIQVTYVAQITPAFNGQPLSLTTNYAKRGADPGSQLSWPININGGTAPYALSVNWGDNTKPQLLSESFSGTVNLSHIYQTAGSYAVTIQATDKNGEIAFLQVVAVANGPAAISQNSSGSIAGGATKTVTKVIWWPLVIFLPLMGVAFWLGGRQSLLNLQKKLAKSDKDLQ